MKYTKCLLGELITQRREKNPGGDFPIAGVSRNGFMPPKQQEADTSIYNVFYLKDFVFNPARMELNSIVFNDKYEKAICSSLYEVFYVSRDDLILPEYLGLWVKRDVFTRYCEFLGSGSAREYCRVSNISQMSIEFPDLETQKKIVDEYRIIRERIEVLEKINDNLEAQAESLFSLAIKNACSTRSLGSFGTVITGKTPSTDVPEFYGEDVPFVKTPDMHGNVYITSSESSLSVLGADSQRNKYIPANTVIVACIGANAGEVAITSFQAQTNQQINAIVSAYPCFLYYSVKAHTAELRALGEGSSTMININKTSFETYEIPSLGDDALAILEGHLQTIFNAVLANLKEIGKLSEVKDVITTQLSH